MEAKMSKERRGVGPRIRRTILFVDNDSYADALRNAWVQLRLADELKVVPDRDKALELLRDAADGRADKPIAVIVVDPEMTGEDTGEFLRQVRRTASVHRAPVMLWTGDAERYRVLEGKSVDAVLQKPMFLRLFQTLLTACQLKVRKPIPHPDGISTGQRR